jgi:thioredoxin reductase
MEYLVIGAGPAGLQLGYHLQQADRDYLVLEAGDTPGSFFKTFPRHRQLISINKPHTGYDDPELRLRMDWNSLLSDDPDLLFTRYTPKYFPQADDMVRYLADYAAKTGVNVKYGARAVKVSRNGAGFRVTDHHGDTYETDRLIVASGPSKPYIPDVPGIETAELYGTMSTDPDDFVDQRVLILGKGNSAFETADNLMETTAVIHVAGPSSINMSWKTHYVGHLRAVNNNFLDTYQLKSQNALLDGDVKRIERTDDGYVVTFSFVRAGEVVKDLRYDRVLVCTGFRFDHSIFDEDCRPELVIKDRFPHQTGAYESTNVHGLYFAGTLTQMRDFKKGTSGFIHGFRYGVRALSKILDQRYHDIEWPHLVLAAEPTVLMDTTLTRVNRTSALWQQFGVLADVITCDSGVAKYHEEVPVGHVHESAFGQSADYFAITLEYGPDHDKYDPFDVTISRIKQDEVGVAHDAAYLHPVVRHYQRGELVGVHHVAENLENEWNRPAHREALVGFFGRELADLPLGVTR